MCLLLSNWKSHVRLSLLLGLLTSGMNGLKSQEFPKILDFVGLRKTRDALLAYISLITRPARPAQVLRAAFFSLSAILVGLSLLVLKRPRPSSVFATLVLTNCTTSSSSSSWESPHLQSNQLHLSRNFHFCLCQPIYSIWCCICKLQKSVWRLH